MTNIIEQKFFHDNPLDVLAQVIEFQNRLHEIPIRNGPSASIYFNNSTGVWDVNTYYYITSWINLHVMSIYNQIKICTAKYLQAIS